MKKRQASKTSNTSANTSTTSVQNGSLPDGLLAEFHRLQPAIRQRLGEFAAVPPEEYFYELCFCLCTPQSKAESANAVVERLRGEQFWQRGHDPTAVLADKSHYVRFHHTKAKRLLLAREQWLETASVLRFSPKHGNHENHGSSAEAEKKRDWLAENINGFGYKEAAHFLRNIGYRGLPILDRHILKHLVRCGVFAEVPPIGTRARYMAAGAAFKDFSIRVGIDMDELDMFFWALEAGVILK
jgi:N-glycosylase/DNA lyase